MFARTFWFVLYVLVNRVSAEENQTSLNNHEITFQRICISKHEAVALNVRTLNQSDDSWRYERRIRVTASECYTLFTGFNNKADMSKRVSVYYKPKPQTKNMKIGSEQESKALASFSRNYSYPIMRLGLIVHPSCPWLGCSPDGFIVSSNTVIEVKTLINERNEDFETALRSVRYLKFSNGSFELREKHKYYAQIQINMFLLRCEKGQLIIYNYKSDEIRLVDVEFNSCFVNSLIDVLQKVYFKYMLSYIFENFLTEEDKRKYQ